MTRRTVRPRYVQRRITLLLLLFSVSKSQTCGRGVSIYVHVRHDHQTRPQSSGNGLPQREREEAQGSPAELNNKNNNEEEAEEKAERCPLSHGTAEFLPQLPQAGEGARRQREDRGEKLRTRRRSERRKRSLCLGVLHEQRFVGHLVSSCFPRHR